MLQATCTIPAHPDSCAHPRAASSWCCLESSSLEIHSLPTVAVGSLELSSTPCLKVKTPTHTEYSLPPGLFISTGMCGGGGRGSKTPLTGQKSTPVQRKMENQTPKKWEADLLEQMGSALK